MLSPQPLNHIPKIWQKHFTNSVTLQSVFDCNNIRFGFVNAYGILSPGVNLGEVGNSM